MSVYKRYTIRVDKNNGQNLKVNIVYITVQLIFLKEME